MKLSDYDRSRALFHLGAASIAGIPAGDVARFYEAFNDIQNDYMMNKVREQLDRCDRAWELSELANENGRFQTKSLYQGDINRAIINISAKDNRVWAENYLEEGRKLAQMLWVPFYRDEESLRYRFARIGQEYINAVPGVADTCGVSRVEATIRYGGGFGF